MCLHDLICHVTYLHSRDHICTFATFLKKYAFFSGKTHISFGEVVWMLAGCLFSCCWGTNDCIGLAVLGKQNWNPRNCTVDDSIEKLMEISDWSIEGQIMHWIKETNDSWSSICIIDSLVKTLGHRPLWWNKICVLYLYQTENIETKLVTEDAFYMASKSQLVKDLTAS